MSVQKLGIVIGLSHLEIGLGGMLLVQNHPYLRCFEMTSNQVCPANRMRSKIIILLSQSTRNHRRITSLMNF